MNSWELLPPRNIVYPLESFDFQWDNENENHYYLIYQRSGVMQLGEMAPEIQVQATNGSTFSSREQTANGPLIVAFFPLAFTPG